MDTAINLGLNHPMGPFTLMDLIGLDTRLAVDSGSHAPATSAIRKYRPCPRCLRHFVASGIGWDAETDQWLYRYYDAAAGG